MVFRNLLNIFLTIIGLVFLYYFGVLTELMYLSIYLIGILIIGKIIDIDLVKKYIKLNFPKVNKLANIAGICIATIFVFHTVPTYSIFIIRQIIISVRMGDYINTLQNVLAILGIGWLLIISTLLYLISYSIIIRMVWLYILIKVGQDTINKDQSLFLE